MFRNLSLRTQLIGVILLVSTLAMVTAGATLFVTEIARSRTALIAELTSLATLLGDRSSATLVFSDDRTARENLSALSHLQHIGSACLFDEGGAVFVTYARRDASTSACVALLPIDASFARFDGSAARVQLPVRSADDLIGAIQINSIAAPLADRLLAQMLSLAVALGSALVLAVVLAIRLQRVISRPLAQVRDVANAVVNSSNYALRAPELGGHELGQLANAFNRMLITIETQNRALVESEAYTRRLFYDSPIAQLVSDPVSRTYLDCNQAAATLHGFATREELIGKTSLDVTAPNQYDGGESNLAIIDGMAIVSAYGMHQREWRYRRPDGALWDGLVNIMQFTLGKRELLHVNVQDITQRKRAEDALHQLNLQLEQRVARRTKELGDTNAALQETLTEIRLMQKELIQREKMASLGALVAGIAHELNTPLGNSLIVSTTMEDRIKSFVADVAANALTKRRLNDFVDSMLDGMTLLSRNLARAAEHVAHFKQVAVDQTSAKRRSFDLHTTIVEIIEMVQPQFKKTPHRMVIDIPPDIVMDSFPGALGQVLTNLLLNSLVHGFSNDMRGEVSITAELDAADQVRMVVADNGGGIPAENLPRVFDPFFTTRLGHGGSGLGLNIVFNIVTATLGGAIRVESEPRVRTAFCIQMPRIARTPAVSSEGP